MYARVFWELPKLLDHADVLFPDLVRLAGPNIGGVTDVLIGALAEGKLDLAGGRIDLEPLTPFAVRQLKKALTAAKRHQRGEGVAWRFTEKYWDVRRMVGCWLDIAGYLTSPDFDPLIVEALTLADPRLAAFAAAARLRRGGETADQ